METTGAYKIAPHGDYHFHRKTWTATDKGSGECKQQQRRMRLFGISRLSSNTLLACTSLVLSRVASPRTRQSVVRGQFETRPLLCYA